MIPKVIIATFLICLRAFCKELRISLTLSDQISTAGAAGFEHFVINDVDFLGVANFWNGISNDMSASSQIFSWSFTEEAFNQFDSFVTYGAHGMDVFPIALKNVTYHVMVIPNYYECEKNNSKKCPSTIIKVWNEKKKGFENLVNLTASGPAQSDHFQIGSDFYIAIAENFSSRISIYRFQMKQSELQSSVSKLFELEMVRYMLALSWCIYNFMTFRPSNTQIFSKTLY